MEEQELNWIDSVQFISANWSLESHLAVDHFLPDEFLKKLSKQFSPGLTDTLAGGEEVHHHAVQPGEQTSG